MSKGANNVLEQAAARPEASVFFRPCVMADDFDDDDDFDEVDCTAVVDDDDDRPPRGIERTDVVKDFFCRLLCMLMLCIISFLLNNFAETIAAWKHSSISDSINATVLIFVCWRNILRRLLESLCR